MCVCVYKYEWQVSDGGKKEQCLHMRVVQELHPNGRGNQMVMVYSNS